MAKLQKRTKQKYHKQNKQQKSTSLFEWRNDKNDDFFDFDVDNKAKPVQQKKNHFDYGNMDSYLDEMDKK